jgi:hypothetical protein
MEYLNWPESKKFVQIIFAGYWILGKDDKYDTSINFENFLFLLRTLQSVNQRKGTP